MLPGSKPCHEARLGMLGAYYRVRVYTASEELCRELVEGFRRARNIDEAVERARRILREHGGCRLLSQDPLIVVTSDSTILVEAVPDSPLANMMHWMLVGRVAEECSSAKDTALNGPG